MKNKIISFINLYLLLGMGIVLADSGSMTIRKCDDFMVTGNGSNLNWNKTEWIELTQRKPESENSTKVKVLYSKTGIYYLFECEDAILTSTMEADQMWLWQEDVVEIFLAPDADNWDHFEYELSPLDYELTLLVAKKGKDIMRWSPFYFEEAQNEKICHATEIIGGEKRSLATVNAWKAEFFIPFRLLSYFQNTPPQSGTRWKANIYRVDYDHGKSMDWFWQPVSGSYHNVDEYGTFIFE